MLRRGHRRNPHAALSGGDGTAIPTNGGGCCGILPDLADIFGPCGGGADDAEVVNGRTTENGTSSGVFVGGSGGSGCPSFPDPFGLVARKAGRSPRPGAGAGARLNSPVPPMLSAPSSNPSTRVKRPSAPTPLGASMSQSSVFDQRLDRLASGVKMMTSTSVSSTGKGRSGAGGGTMAAPGLVPKFRSSPLPFSANLHVTPLPRRVSGQQQGKSSVVKNAASAAGRRVRGGTNSGRAGCLSTSTGFGRAAAPSTPSAPGLETFQTNSSTKRDRHRKPTALPSMPMMMMPMMMMP